MCNELSLTSAPNLTLPLIFAIQPITPRHGLSFPRHPSPGILPPASFPFPSRPVPAQPLTSMKKTCGSPPSNPATHSTQIVSVVRLAMVQFLGGSGGPGEETDITLPVIKSYIVKLCIKIQVWGRLDCPGEERD